MMIFYTHLLRKLIATIFDNITQWAKQTRCWELVQELNTKDIESSLLQKFSANKEEVLYKKKVATETKKLDNSIQIQSFVVGVKPDIWKKIYTYFQENRQGISLTDMEVLSSMVKGKIRLASPNQSKCLYRLYCNAQSLGLIT